MSQINENGYECECVLLKAGGAIAATDVDAAFETPKKIRSFFFF